MDFEKLLKGAAQGAMSIMPTVATALGGPFAGMAVSWIGKTLLGDEAAAPGDVAQAVQQALMTPDGAARLREIDTAFQLKCREMEIDLEKVHAADRDSARKREATTGDSWTPRLLAGLTTAGFFGLIGVMCFVKVPIENRDAIMLAIGALGAGWSAILQYYFGSSRGSAAKDQILGRMNLGGR